MKTLQEDLWYWKDQMRFGIHSKITKIYILKQLQSVADKLGIKVPDYNSDEFRSFLRD